MLFEKVEKRRIITFYFKISTVDVGECIQPQQHWSKQGSEVVAAQKGCFPSFKFCQGVSSFISLANEVTNFQSFFTIYHSGIPVTLDSFYFNTGHLH